MRHTVAILLLSASLCACSGTESSPDSGNSGSASATSPAAAAGGPITSIASGMPGVPPIQVKVVNRGSGRQAKTGDRVSLHYVGTFKSGEKFDSSRDRGEPFNLRAGMGEVIKGWDMTILSMRVGDRWTVTIPYQLAYGERGHPAGIPARTDLVFDMELMSAQ